MIIFQVPCLTATVILFLFFWTDRTLTGTVKSFPVHSSKVHGMDSGGLLFPWLQWGKNFKKKKTFFNKNIIALIYNRLIDQLHINNSGYLKTYLRMLGAQAQVLAAICGKT